MENLTIGPTLRMRVADAEAWLRQSGARATNELIDSPAALTTIDLDAVSLLESTYRSWAERKSPTAKAAALNEASPSLEHPNAVDLWLPARTRGEHSKKAEFVGDLNRVARARASRRRAFPSLLIDEWHSSAIDVTPRLPSEPSVEALPRRCEGRSRAPAGSRGGGAGRGGRRSGGGRGGGDSGGDGSGSGDGDGPSRRLRGFFRHPVVATVIGAVVATAVSPLLSGSPTLEVPPDGIQVTMPTVITESRSGDEAATSGEHPERRCRTEHPMTEPSDPASPSAPGPRNPGCKVEFPRGP